MRKTEKTERLRVRSKTGKWFSELKMPKAGMSKPKTKKRRGNGFRINGTVVPRGSLRSNENHPFSDSICNDNRREAFLNELSLALSEVRSGDTPEVSGQERPHKEKRLFSA